MIDADDTLRELPQLVPPITIKTIRVFVANALSHLTAKSGLWH